MPTVSIDHIAIPTANAERLMAFYKRLGFPINNEEAWRAGTVPTFSIQVGEYSKINVHPEGFTASLRGPTAVPGCMDICFVWEELWRNVRRCSRRPGWRLSPLGEARRWAWPGPDALAEPLCSRPGRQSAGMDDLPGVRGQA